MGKLEITPAGISRNEVNRRGILRLFKADTACLYLGVTEDRLAELVEAGEVESSTLDDGNVYYNIISYAAKIGRPFDVRSWFDFQMEHQHVPWRLVDWSIDATVRERYWPRAEQACYRLGVTMEELQAMVGAGEVLTMETDGETRYDIWKFINDGDTKPKNRRKKTPCDE